MAVGDCDFAVHVAVDYVSGAGDQGPGTDHAPAGLSVFCHDNDDWRKSGTIDFPSAAGFDNRQLACQTYTFEYTASATSGSITSIGLQAATGAVTAGTFNAWSGTVATGIDPDTSSVTGITTYTTGCASASACATPNSWIRIQLTRSTFVGTIRGVLMGYRSGSGGGGGGGGGGSGCVGTVMAPCIVEGVAASGSSTISNPVLMGGVSNSGAIVRIMNLDTSGGVTLSGGNATLADGLSNSTQAITTDNGQFGQQVYPLFFNGSTWDRQFRCNLSAPITITAGTDAVIAAGVASTNTRVCHIDFSSDTASTVTFRQGTGTTCLTNTLALTGGYANVVTAAFDYQPTADLTTTITGRDLCIHTSATVANLGGVVIYAQY